MKTAAELEVDKQFVQNGSLVDEAVQSSAMYTKHKDVYVACLFKFVEADVATCSLHLDNGSGWTELGAAWVQHQVTDPVSGIWVSCKNGWPWDDDSKSMLVGVGGFINQPTAVYLGSERIGLVGEGGTGSLRSFAFTGVMGCVQDQEIRLGEL